MKKSRILMSLVFFFMFAGTLSAKTSDRTINLIIGKNEAKINGNNATMSAPAQVIEGSTMVPLRFIGEAFGCDVQWDSSLGKAVVTLGNQTIEAPVGKDYAIINGDKTTVAVPALLINGNTYVPLRFISENLGAKVDYDAKTRGIVLSMQKYMNEEQGFEMVVPTGWTVGKETDDGVEISLDDIIQGQIGFADPADGIDASNFNTFAEGCFEEYSDQDELETFVNDLCAYALYYEETGLYNIHAYKLLDGGIYYCIIVAPEVLFDENLGLQSDLIINTLTSPTSK